MTTSKKKAPRKRAGKAAAAPQPIALYHEKKSVRITQADNGFTVSCYGPKGEEIKIATSIGTMVKHAKAMLGGGK